MLQAVKKSILVSALILSAIFLFSCTVNNTPDSPVDIITYKDMSVNSDMFRFLLAVEKTDAVYAMYRDTVDKPEYWETEDGHTTADMIKRDAATYAKTLVYYAHLANLHKLTVTEEEFQKTYQNYIDQFGGTEEALEKEMASYGFTLELLKEFINLSLMSDAGINYIHEASGIDPLNDADYERYYKSSYITLRHLYLNDFADEDGNYLDSDKRGAVKARADEIDELISAGADLSEFAAESDDGVIAEYPDGITIPLDNDLYRLAQISSDSENMNIYGMYYYLIYSNPDFTSALLGSKVGEVVRVKLDDGYFFVQRLETDMEDYEQYLPMIKTCDGIRTMKINDTLNLAKGDFAENKDAIALMLIKDIPVVKE